jgi:hypothetical protein
MAQPLMPNAPEVLEDGPSISREALFRLVMEYWQEARDARETGLEARDEIWRQSIDAYYGRQDFSGKAEWQSRVTLRDTARFADRYAASLGRALMQVGRDWYEPQVPQNETPLIPLVRKLLDYHLARCGSSPMGHPVGFRKPFKQTAKAGTMLAMVSAVTWDSEQKRVRLEPVDAREIYLDPTGRGMYRVRRYEVDHYELLRMAEETDADGDSVWDREAIDRLVSTADREMESERERTSRTGRTRGPQSRRPHVLKEFLCVLVNEDGERLTAEVEGRVVDKWLVVLGDDLEVIRGPEPNPFWHGLDWIVYHPLIDVPFSIYGKTYTEDFLSIVEAHEDLTRLLLDSTAITTLKSYAIKPNLLEDPTQIDDGMRPLKLWLADDDADMEQFIREIEMGSVPSQSIAIWQGLRGAAREAAKQNDIDLGQVPQKGDITATEITTVESQGGEMVLDVAEGIDEGYLSVVLSLVFWTGLQYMDPQTDESIADQLGEDIAAMVTAQRQDFRWRRYSFKVKAIAGVAERNEAARKLLQLLQLVGTSEALVNALLGVADMGKLMGEIMRSIGFDWTRIAKTTPPDVQPGIAPDGSPAELPPGAMTPEQATSQAVDAARTRLGVEGGA